MRFIRLSIFLLFFSFTKVFAQQEFMLNGVLFENGTKIRIALAEISNQRNGYSVGTNDMGLFNIRAAIGDTLVIYKRGFNDIRIAVSSSKDLVLYLNRGNTLQEVIVTGQSRKKALDDIKQDFKDKGSFYGGKPPALSFLFTPLTALYELFGRTPRNARRFNNYYQTEIQQTHIDGLFNKSIIHEHTKLEGKELENFMINYRPEYEQAKNWTQYDAIKWINESYKKYLDTAKKIK
jgi:hypothetical protein